MSNKKSATASEVNTAENAIRIEHLREALVFLHSKGAQKAQLSILHIFAEQLRDDNASLYLHFEWLMDTEEDPLIRSDAYTDNLYNKIKSKCTGVEKLLQVFASETPPVAHDAMEFSAIIRYKLEAIAILAEDNEYTRLYITAMMYANITHGFQSSLYLSSIRAIEQLAGGQSALQNRLFINIAEGIIALANQQTDEAIKKMTI